MIVNAAIFTCSICGEASSNICAYCTKDACANHRCERCKRCSDCCECEFPLSAEEPAAAGPVTQAVAEPLAEPEVFVREPAAPEAPEPEFESGSPFFLTAAESSVFVAGSVPSEPLEATEPDPLDPRDPFSEPRE
jgi:hypothetical protein